MPHSRSSAPIFGSSQSSFENTRATPSLSGSRVAQHRAIMETLDAELKGGVHALAIEIVSTGSPQPPAGNS